MDFILQQRASQLTQQRNSPAAAKEERKEAAPISSAFMGEKEKIPDKYMSNNYWKLPDEGGDSLDDLLKDYD